MPPLSAAIENAFDAFSWNSFIALNWPPGADGQGDPKKKPGQSGDNATVWENWIGLDSMFLDGGKAPSWDAPPAIPQACEVHHQKGEPVLVMVGKTPNLLTAAEQPFVPYRTTHRSEWGLRAVRDSR
jgi:hypothetical protein